MEQPSSASVAEPDGYYVVTAQKPLNVNHAVVGRFTGPQDTNLILGCAAGGP